MCRWVCRSSGFLLPLVAEVMSDPFLGAVNDSGSVSFASVDVGASALGP